MHDHHAPEAGAFFREAGGDLDELRRMHGALAVALELLDELMQLLPERPDAAGLREVEDVLREIRDLAGTGLRGIRKACDADGGSRPPRHVPA
ncbi:MAG: hypothetical protein ABTQ31_12485 [Rhizobiaceae bacterium]